MTRTDILHIFQKEFGPSEFLVFAPGRANIIGEHTDYNDGYVLPFAIGQGVWFVARKTAEPRLDIIASNTGERAVMELNGESMTDFGWQKFFRQVLVACQQLPVPGLQLVFGGDLPIGAGISSSSAITCGLIETLNLAAGWQLNSGEMVSTAVIAETGYGVRGGIMDQYTIFNAKQNQAILLDCRSNTHDFVPLELGGHQFLLINTNVKHNLIHTDYNNRRAECERALTSIKSLYPNVVSLRELDQNMLPQIKDLLDKTLYNRVAFVIEENQRVLQAVEALTSQNFDLLGQLLNQSHKGLSDLYNVSCQELDWLAELAENHPGFLGGRMMGGGFGGCTINILHQPLSQEETELITRDYIREFGFAPTFIPIVPENGIIARLTED
ncbi:MAG: galactokinase [Saprospiraceae bacterium]|jgi:galactokinase|nr:galactokinase [Saprospiraceae bacterium]